MSACATPPGPSCHPTQKPEALLHRVIMACTQRGDVVLDPFLGSGTTAAVARRLGRRFIGIERDPTYAQAALARIAAVEPLSDEMVANTPSKREQPRIPFGMLVERGLVAAGEALCDRHRRWTATVQPDGRIQCGTARGSIHAVGAAVQETPSCNGWTFWHHVGRDGALKLLDSFRQDLLAS
jgi:modification methylase